MTINGIISTSEPVLNTAQSTASSLKSTTNIAPGVATSSEAEADAKAIAAARAAAENPEAAATPVVAEEKPKPAKIVRPRKPTGPLEVNIAPVDKDESFKITIANGDAKKRTFELTQQQAESAFLLRLKEEADRSFAYVPEEFTAQTEYAPPSMQLDFTVYQGEDERSSALRSITDDKKFDEATTREVFVNYADRETLFQLATYGKDVGQLIKNEISPDRILNNTTLISKRFFNEVDMVEGRKIDPGMYVNSEI